MDSTQKAIKDKIDSLPIEQAREFVTTLPSNKGSINQDFAESCLAVKEAALRDSKDAESLSIAREALSGSKDANAIARKAFRLAILAMILSSATAIGIAIFQWFTKK